MKKVLASILLLLAVAGSASAAATALSSHTPTTAAGTSVTGGVDQNAANTASTPLIKFSTGVKGLVNFNSATHDGYLIATKHSTGSKVFATLNSTSAIYWKQVTKGDLANTEVPDGTDASVLVGSGWTSY